jgi:RNA polymerase sigma-70 factor (ECF subfamily)
VIDTSLFCVIVTSRSVSLREEIRAATDEALASAMVREPSDELCTELFRRYSKKVYLWSFNYTHDVDEAVELSQEIFMKIFRNIGSFSGLARFSTWVYQVTRNHCLSTLSKKRSQWRKRLQPLESGDAADVASATFYDRADSVRELERILEVARTYMEDEELKAFILHYWEGLTVREITKLLGCSNVTGARTLIQNARRKFSRLVKEEGFGNA